MFYSSIFDPELIIYEIIVMQSIFYLTLSLWLLIFHLTLASSLSLNMMLSSAHMSIYSTHHTLDTYISILSILLTSPIVAFALLLVVGRSKKCLDHVATIHILHVLICTLFYHFPTRFEYWVTHIIAATISTVAGEYLCMQREMATIQRSDEGDARVSGSQQRRVKSGDQQQQQHDGQIEMGVMNGNSHRVNVNDSEDEHERLLMSNGNNHHNSNNASTNASNSNNALNNHIVTNDTTTPPLPRHTSTQSVEDIDIELGMSNAKLRVARPLMLSV